MIAKAVVEQIRRLLTEDQLSQREIARRLHVSRGTVDAIASGKRPERNDTPDKEEAPFLTTGPLVRCPTCGGKVYMPCLLCQVRAMQREGRIKASHPPRRLVAGTRSFEPQ